MNTKPPRPDPRERLAAAERRLQKVGVELAQHMNRCEDGLRRLPAPLLVLGGAAAGAVIGRVAPPLPAVLPAATSLLRWSLTLASLANVNEAANQAEANGMAPGHGD